MKKLIIIGTIILVGIVAIVFYGIPTNTSEQTGTKLKVVASFYPLAEFAKQVGGDRIEVVNMTPVGMGPHDFEPTPKDVATLFSSKVFILNGSGLDPWAKKLAPELKKTGITTVEIASHFDLLASTEEDEHGAEEGTEEIGGHKAMDPHIWLDPLLAKKEVEIIRDTLIDVDPTNAQTYTANTQQYLAQLSALDEKIRTGLSLCEKKDIVASHGAFGYFAKRYNLRQISIAGISPEEEPSPKRMAEISQLAKQKNIKYIFFETLVSPKLSETIAREIGAETLVFNPIEGLTNEEIGTGENYISVMEKNLENLKVALICK